MAGVRSGRRYSGVPVTATEGDKMSQPADTNTVTDTEEKSNEITKCLDVDKERSEAAKAEQTRILAVNQICKEAGLEAAKFITSNATVEEVRKAAYEQLLKKDEPVKDVVKPKIEIVRTEQDNLRGALVSYLSYRTTSHEATAVEAKKELSARQFDPTMDFVSAVKRYANEPWANPQEVLSRVIASGDLGGILTDALNKELMREYDSDGGAYQGIVRTRRISNLHDAKINLFDVSLNPDDIVEGDEYRFATPVTNEDRITVVKRGKGFKFTEEAMLRDDLDALSTLSSKFNRSFRIFERKQVFDLITNAATQVQGGNLFSSNRGNVVVISGDTTVTIKSVDDMRVAMAKQKSPDGDEINIRPRYILCPEVLRGNAASFLQNTFVPQEFQNQTQAYNDGIRAVISDPILDTALGTNADKTFYLVASADETEVVQRVVLSGKENPEILSRYDDRMSALIFYSKFYVGFGIADFRGIVRGARA